MPQPKANPVNLRRRACRIQEIALDGKLMAQRWEPGLNVHRDRRREIADAFGKAAAWARHAERLLET